MKGKRAQAGARKAAAATKGALPQKEEEQREERAQAVEDDPEGAMTTRAGPRSVIKASSATRKRCFPASLWGRPPAST